MSIFLRKIFRLCGLIFPVMYLFWGRQVLLGVCGSFLLFFLILEVIRFKYPSFNQKLFSYFSSLLKEKEKEKISGTTLFLIATFITILIFPREIAILSLLYLVIGDTLSALVGFSLGRVKIGEKSLEGFLACFSGCLIVGLFLKRMGFSFSLLGLFLSSLGVALIEIFPFIDDNLSIPLVGGVLLYAFR